MSEEKEQPKETPKEDTGAGDKPREADLVDRANEAAKRLDEQNERLEKNLAEQKELEAKRILGGKSLAGQEAPEEKKLTPEEYAKKVQLGEANPLKDDGFI